MAGRLIGIIGGLGPGATIFYYKELIAEYRRRGLPSPRVVIYSLPIEEMCRAARNGDTAGVASLIGEALESLASAGAGLVVLAANTPHMAWSLFERRASGLGVSIIHIADPAAERLRAIGARRVGILATSGTLRAGFYQERLEGLGLEPVEPDAEYQSLLDGAIEALATSAEQPRDSGSLRAVLETARHLASKGVDALLVACTDISPFSEVIEREVGVPLVDSSVEHVKAVVDLALALGAR